LTLHSFDITKGGHYGKTATFAARNFSRCNARRDVTYWRAARRHLSKNIARRRM